MKKPIGPKAHGILDYGFTAVLLLAPLLLKFKRPAKRFAYGEAAKTLLFNGLSKTGVGIQPVIPFNPAHKALDIITLAGFLVLPRITGASRQPAAKRFFQGILAAGIIHVLLTDYKGRSTGVTEE
jgi:hypothetical protein